MKRLIVLAAALLSAVGCSSVVAPEDAAAKAKDTARAEQAKAQLQGATRTAPGKLAAN